MHIPPEGWNPFSIEASHKTLARGIVKTTVQIKSGELLVDIGSDLKRWARRWSAQSSRFNLVATLMDLDDPALIQRCQHKGCASGKMRRDSEGDPGEYRGAM